MTIANENQFPENLVEVLDRHLSRLECVKVVVGRSLNPTDPHGTTGIEVVRWNAEEYEIGGSGEEPTISTHTLAIQHVVIHSDPEEGEALHRKSARDIRMMLLRDTAFQTDLRQLKEQGDGRTERIQKMRVPEQEYASNKIETNFVSMSGTTVLFQTETTNS